MFGAISELASVMEFGFNLVDTPDEVTVPAVDVVDVVVSCC